MYMVLVRADLQELDLLPRLDLQTYLPQDLIDGRIEHRSTILGRKHQMIQQNRDVIALVDLAAHPPRLRRKRRRMQPAGIQPEQSSGRQARMPSTATRSRGMMRTGQPRELIGIDISERRLDVPAPPNGVASGTEPHA